MAETTSNGVPDASKDSQKPEDSTAAANEAATTTRADSAPTTTVEETKETAPETAEAAAASGDADDTLAGQEDADENGDAANHGEGTNGVTGSAKKSHKRKSGSGVPEHKNKKLNRKKSLRALPTLHLDVEPGSYWYAHMKGHPPWPSIVCDEDMLPESLLSKRPVSAANADGTYRDDFLEGGKNARDRRYPIMFLHTNEFAWHVNTELQPLDKAEVKELVAKDDKGKKTKALWEAYVVASEDHDLDYFKGLIEQHEKNLQEEQEAIRLAEIEKAEAKAEAEAKKAEKAAEKASKKDKRKSGVKPKKESEDEDMPDADGEASSKKKGTKRKKTEEGDADGVKPVKTPKILKVNGPKTDSETKAKKSAQKTKKSKATDEDSAETPKQAEEKPLTEEEKKVKLHKSVLYLRHKLQKGFLNRDQEPKAEEMDTMNEQFKQLEAVENITADVIRTTKINKVLKAIIRLTSIPKEEEHEFKRRSTDLLQDYNKILAADGGASEPPPSATEATTNGVKTSENESASAEAETSKTETKDVTMTDAPAEIKDAVTTSEGEAAPTTEPVKAEAETAEAAE